MACKVAADGSHLYASCRLNASHSSAAMPTSSGVQSEVASASLMTWRILSFSSAFNPSRSEPAGVRSTTLAMKRRPLSRKSGSTASCDPDGPVGTAVDGESESIKVDRVEAERSWERRADGEEDCVASWERRKAVLARSLRDGSAATQRTQRVSSLAQSTRVSSEQTRTLQCLRQRLPAVELGETLYCRLRVLQGRREAVHRLCPSLVRRVGRSDDALHCR